MEGGGDDDRTSARHYFTAVPGGRDERVSFTVEGVWGTLHMESASGVFASHGLDKGTSVLLETLRRHPPVAPADDSLVVDLGCGSGVLALVMARLWPACRVMAVDVNSRALELCTANARRNGLGNVVTCAPEDAGDGPVARLWSNPPVRIGKEALHALLEAWIPRLAADGEARMVIGALSTERMVALRLPDGKFKRVTGMSLNGDGSGTLLTDVPPPPPFTFPEDA